MTNPVFEYEGPVDCDFRLVAVFAGKAPATVVQQHTHGRMNEPLILLSLLVTPIDYPSPFEYTMPWVGISMQSAALIVSAIEDSAKKLDQWMEYTFELERYRAAVATHNDG